MGARLAEEVAEVMEDLESGALVPRGGGREPRSPAVAAGELAARFGSPPRVSFAAHSVGVLIVRAALTHPAMAPYLPSLHLFLSISGPHLGYVGGEMTVADSSTPRVDALAFRVCDARPRLGALGAMTFQRVDSREVHRRAPACVAGMTRHSPPDRNPATMSRSGCGGLYYCSREHQEMHWSDLDHNESCERTKKQVARTQELREDIIIFAFDWGRSFWQFGDRGKPNPLPHVSHKGET